jgi:hypothetical protein
MNITGLIERLEKADGPDRRLDNDICEMLMGWPEAEWRSVDYMKTFGLAVTSSVDAALYLLKDKLPGWHVENLCQWEAPALRDRGEWMCDVVAPQKPGEGRRHSKCSHAPSAALALCLAILKAKQQSGEAAE